MYSTRVVYTHGAARVVSADDDRGRIRSGRCEHACALGNLRLHLLRVSQQACEANCRHAPVSHRQQRRTDDTEDTEARKVFRLAMVIVMLLSTMTSLVWRVRSQSERRTDDTEDIETRDTPLENIGPPCHRMFPITRFYVVVNVFTSVCASTK